MERNQVPVELSTQAYRTAKKKEHMILALEKTLGVVAPASRKAHIHRNTHYRWCKADPEYKAKVDSVKELALDFVEAMLFKRISEDSDIMIMYYLNSQGACRGYGCKPVVSNSEPEIPVRIIREERAG